jgi:hypothetical protein
MATVLEIAEFIREITSQESDIKLEKADMTPFVSWKCKDCGAVVYKKKLVPKHKKLCQFRIKKPINLVRKPRYYICISDERKINLVPSQENNYKSLAKFIPFDHYFVFDEIHPQVHDWSVSFSL